MRVDADEVTYPLHVILRFELEQSLIGGQLETDEFVRLASGAALSADALLAHLEARYVA